MNTLSEKEIDKLQKRRLEEVAYLERNSTSLKETAKLIGVKWTVFIKYLLDKRYLYKSSTVKKNIAYDKYTTKKGNCLFYVKVETNRLNGYKNIQTKVTPKGVEYFRRKLEEVIK